MKSVNFLAIAALMIGAVACGNNKKTADQEVANAADTTCCCAGGCVMGAWEQPISGMEGTQGFKLEKDGNASSINMATLVFEKWNKQGDTLILCGKSIGNGQTLDFSNTLMINKLTKDSLILTNNGEVVWSLAKKGCCKEASDSTGCKKSCCDKEEKDSCCKK